MNMPGFTAEASIYKSAVTYATGTGVLVMYETAVTPQQSSTLGRSIISPISFPQSKKTPTDSLWHFFCRSNYWNCRVGIDRCKSDCVRNNLWRCASMSDSEECAWRVGLRCSGRCIVRCDEEYARCLRHA